MTDSNLPAKKSVFRYRSTSANFLTVAVAVGLALLVLIAIAAPVVAPFDRNAQDLSSRLLPPLSGWNILGTDQLGRDILSRIVYGTRIALTVGFISVAVGGTIGIVMGLRRVGFAKVLRAEVMSIREREFVEASRASGATYVVIMFRHILPTCAAPMIVLGSFEAVRMIIVAAGLDFFWIRCSKRCAELGGHAG